MVLTASAQDGTKHSTFISEASAFAGNYSKVRSLLTEKYPGCLIVSPIERLPSATGMQFIEVTVFVERVAGSGRLGSYNTWFVERKATQ